MDLSAHGLLIIIIVFLLIYPMFSFGNGTGQSGQMIDTSKMEFLGLNQVTDLSLNYTINVYTDGKKYYFIHCNSGKLLLSGDVDNNKPKATVLQDIHDYGAAMNKIMAYYAGDKRSRWLSFIEFYPVLKSSIKNNNLSMPTVWK